jgi:hypothetical protein
MRESTQNRRTRRATARRSRRGRSRAGMAMLLVMLLIVMVSAAGVFAAKSASMDVRSAGYVRQAAQTEYVSETGLMMPIVEMRRNCTGYLGLMLQQQRMAMGAPDAWLEEHRVQWRFGLADLQRPVGGVAPPPVYRAPTGVGATRTPGSFGMGLAEAAFDTRVTSLGRVPATLYGFSLDSRINMVAFLFESRGRVQLNGVTDPNETGAGTIPSRAVAVVPCEL